jgi:hypothetical protein
MTLMVDVAATMFTARLRCLGYRTLAGFGRTLGKSVCPYIALAEYFRNPARFHTGLTFSSAHWIVHQSPEMDKSHARIPVAAE